MHNKKPPFTVTNQILNQIAEIAELIGRLNAAAGLSASPTLRRSNRIRTIYSSLAIEQNTLSLEQVTAVLNGKRVLPSWPTDISSRCRRCVKFGRMHKQTDCRDAERASRQSFSLRAQL